MQLLESSSIQNLTKSSEYRHFFSVSTTHFLFKLKHIFIYYMGTNEPDSTKTLWQPKPKHLSTCFARNCLKSYLSQKWWDSMLCFKFSSCFPSVLWGKKRFNCTLLVLQVSRTKNNLSKKGFPHNFSHTLQKVVLKKKLLKTFFLVKICVSKKITEMWSERKRKGKFF
jgi:hypothetical protein